jgi:hypothetical protein
MVIALGWCLLFLLGDPQLTLSEVPAAGRHTSFLEIQETGRYSVQVASDRGVALTILDAMAGPIASDGLPGERDGRADVLLERGRYKLVTRGDAGDPGQARLSALPFVELETEPQPLEPLAVHETTLGDLEQRSFWVVVDEPVSGQAGELRLEVMGRALGDCVLWLPGSWRTGAAKSVLQREPVSGRPMTYFEFHDLLPAGQYLLTCYGGQSLDWAEEDGSAPLYVRLGVRESGAQGTHPVTISPFGHETFLLPAQSNYFEVARTNIVPTRLTVREYTERGPRLGSGRLAVMDKDSRQPHLSLEGNYGSRRQWLHVEAQPGDTLAVQYFARSYYHRFRSERRG